MKEKTELVRGWLRKASSDLLAMDASLNAGALDVACFHAQQAAEKYLKAYLTHAGLEFPYTHNLTKLLEICMKSETSFDALGSLVIPLSPYAVELRYDIEFWPSLQTAQAAHTAAQAVRDFVLDRLPKSLTEAANKQPG